MRSPLSRLSVGLQTVVQSMKQSSHRAVTDLMSAANQRVREMTSTLAGPAQRRLRVSTGGRLDQGLQVFEELPVALTETFATPAGTAHPLTPRRLGFAAPLRVLELNDAGPDRRPRHPSRLGNRCHAASSQCGGLARRPQPANPLVHQGAEGLKLLSHLSNGVSVRHSSSVASSCKMNKLFLPRS